MLLLKSANFHFDKCAVNKSAVIKAKFIQFNSHNSAPWFTLILKIFSYCIKIPHKAI